MNRVFIKTISVILLVVVLLSATHVTTYASSSVAVYDKGGWKVYLDSPDSEKPYYHLPFYEKGKHIYCLRLDNMKPCDSTAGNKDKVQKTVMKKYMSIQK